MPALLALLLAGCATTPKPSIGGKLFSDLRVGDRIHIQYASNGCFHSFAYGFDFERDTVTTLRITSLSRLWSESAKSWIYVSPKPLGELVLTPRDVSGLDRLVCYYRSRPQGGCTTMDDISIEHLHADGKPGMTETYHDASCASDKVYGVTLLSSLARRLEWPRGVTE